MCYMKTELPTAQDIVNAIATGFDNVFIQTSLQAWPDYPADDNGVCDVNVLHQFQFSADDISKSAKKFKNSFTTGSDDLPSFA